MTTPAPRHPWKAVAAAIAVFALVHGARATVFPNHDAPLHVHVGHAVDADCPGVHVHIDDDDNEAGDADDLPVDAFEAFDADIH